MPGGVSPSYFLPGDLDFDDDGVSFESDSSPITSAIASKALDNLCNALNLVQNSLAPSKPFASVGFKKVGKVRFHSKFVDLGAIGQEKQAREKLCRDRELFVRDRLSECSKSLNELLAYLSENPNHCRKSYARSPVIQPTDIWTYDKEKPICVSRHGSWCRCSTCC